MTPDTIRLLWIFAALIIVNVVIFVLWASLAMAAEVDRRQEEAQK